jgi:phosphoribosylamine--glycine ligase
MKAAGVPTAEYYIEENHKKAKEIATDMLKRLGGAVIKASGLAGGKGVFVCSESAQIAEAFDRLSASMKDASETLVIEEVLKGRECSYFTFIGEGGASPLGFAVDFKRLKDGDVGPNTGGMGCYTPVSWLPDNAQQIVHEKIIDPLLVELTKQDIKYVGCLYVGIMWGEKGPSVVEFNVRLGDPEAQVLAVQDKRDWGKLIASKLGLYKEGLDAFEVDTQKAQHKSVAVVMASSSYPYGAEEAEGPVWESSIFANEASDQAVFGAAVKQKGSKLQAVKGRVLTVASSCESFEKARAKSYEKVKDIASDWTGVQFRNDVANKVVETN